MAYVLVNNVPSTPTTRVRRIFPKEGMKPRGSELAPKAIVYVLQTEHEKHACICSCVLRPKGLPTCDLHVSALHTRALRLQQLIQSRAPCSTYQPRLQQPAVASVVLNLCIEDCKKCTVLA